MITPKSGAYFVAIVTQNRACLFGDVVDWEMRLNEFGRIVEFTRHDLVNHVAGIVLDAFVIMPNHVCGIVIIVNNTVGSGLGEKIVEAGSDEIVGVGFNEIVGTGSGEKL